MLSASRGAECERDSTAPTDDDLAAYLARRGERVRIMRTRRAKTPARCRPGPTSCGWSHPFPATPSMPILPPS